MLMEREAWQEGIREINTPTSLANPPKGWRAKGARWYSHCGSVSWGKEKVKKGGKWIPRGKWSQIQHPSETAKGLEWLLCIFTSTEENSKVISFSVSSFISPGSIRNIIIIKCYGHVLGRGQNPTPYL